MKILVMSYAFAPRVSGVAELCQVVYGELLKRGLADEVRLLCFRDAGTPEFSESGGIQLWRFRNMTCLNGRVQFAGRDFTAKLRTLLVEFKPDQVHIHTRFGFTSLRTLTMAKQLGVKVVYFEHLAGYVAGEGPLIDALCWLWDQLISRRLLAGADAAVCISRSVESFVREKLRIARPLLVIENPAAHPPDRRSFAEKFAGRRPARILFASRLIPLKNPLMVLESARILQQRKSFDFTLCMAGDGALAARARAFARRHGMSDIVEFPGRLSKAEVGARLRESDILVNPSNLEGLPGVVIEALLSNNIVIATDVGGNRDVLDVSELLIERKRLSPAALADRIEYVFRSYPELLAPLERNKQRCLEAFALDAAVRKYKELLLEPS